MGWRENPATPPRRTVHYQTLPTVTSTDSPSAGVDEEILFDIEPGAMYSVLCQVVVADETETSVPVDTWYTAAIFMDNGAAAYPYKIQAGPPVAFPEPSTSVLNGVFDNRTISFSLALGPGVRIGLFLMKTDAAGVPVNLTGETAQMIVSFERIDDATSGGVPV